MVAGDSEDAEELVLYRISLACLRKIAHKSESSNTSEPAEKNERAQRRVFQRDNLFFIPWSGGDSKNL
jgi:hypothetical protein